jgi:hypothetical protein
MSDSSPFNAVVTGSNPVRPTIYIHILRLTSVGLCFLRRTTGAPKFLGDPPEAHKILLSLPRNSGTDLKKDDT